MRVTKIVGVGAVALALLTACGSGDSDKDFNQRRADCFAEHGTGPDAVRECMSQP